MARYYWIKLKDTFFQDKHIKKLRKLPGGSDCVIAYMKMMLASTKTNGIITLDGIEETPAEEIALMIDETKEICQMTMAYGLKVGFIQQMDDLSACKLLQVEQLLDSETEDASRKRENRFIKNNLLLPEPQEASFRMKKLRAKNWCKKNMENISAIEISDNENNTVYGGYYYLTLRKNNGYCMDCNERLAECVVSDIGNLHDTSSLIAMCSICREKIDMNPLRDVTNPLRDVTNPLRDVTNPLRDVTEPLRDSYELTSLNNQVESLGNVDISGFIEPVTKTENVRTNSLDIDIEIDTYNSNYNSISTALEYYSSKIGVPSSETRSKLYYLEQQYSFDEIKVAIDIAWKQKKGSIGYISKVLENERARQEEKEPDGYRQTKAARKTTEATTKKQRLNGPDWENLEPGKL